VSNQSFRRLLIRLLLINLIVIAAMIVWNRHQRQDSIQLAIAKGAQLLDMPAMLGGYTAAYQLDTDRLKSIALADPGLQATLAGQETEFVSALPLTLGEARYWQDEGCGDLNCAYVTLYDPAASGTLEAVVNLERGEVLGHWSNANARPAGSNAILPKAIAIAAADSRVRSILGADIGAMDPAMIPMSGWLADDDCRDEWCVDLTFHDPSGTGRIFHVFVNLEQEQVARTFYTRARADRSPAAPLAQRDAFSNGCHEQYGWNVCWEMTANDGVNFRDATYNGQSIFSSVKIGQIEAWYPSWPGGYRDEIGFAATVPPFGGTEVTDLGDGFEVKQMFTEFTRWPNCICCYRYEEIIRLYADGRFELIFVSHGPGCDDLSIYRPFWRIDLDLDGGPGDEVWYFEGTQWVEGLEEFEIFPIVEDLSPEGHKLATFDGDLHYRWSMARTDPLGLDEGYLFLLQKNDMEGEGPITTGPGDTFIPPRQWIDGDPLSGEDIVVWHVPLLYTKKGDPWWCMPDPDPDFSPCDAILRAEPAGELRQPTAEELAAGQPAEPTPSATEDPAASPAPSPTSRPIEGEDAEAILLNAGCVSCHQIGSLGEAHKVGPDLTWIGYNATGRVPGMPAEVYIRQSIVEPNAYLAPECPNGPCMANIMPRDYGSRLSEGQLQVLVDYLLQQQGPEPTPAIIGGVLSSPTILPKTGLLGKASPPQPAALMPGTLLQLGIVLVVLAISGALLYLSLRKRPGD
jgi:hypothetical protein